MKVTLRRGCIQLRAWAGPTVQVPLVAPVNDLLALSSERIYVQHLASSYPGFWPRLQEAETSVREWLAAGVPCLFAEATEAASRGSLSPSIISYTAAVVRRAAPDSDEVNDLPALGAWALERLLERRAVVVRPCSSCGRPWIPPTRYPHNLCHRPRPGFRLSCFEVNRQSRWASRNRDWRREYKKLHERVRAGTLPAETFKAWRAANTPSSWHPLEDWIAGRTTTASSASALP